jgi:hypothetical protein
METRLPCNVGDVLAGILKDDDGQVRGPFTGRVHERAVADPPYAATLLIVPHDLPLRPPFDPE